MKYLILLLSIAVLSGCTIKPTGNFFIDTINGNYQEPALRKATEEYNKNKTDFFVKYKKDFQQIHKDIIHVEEVGISAIQEALQEIDNSRVKDPYKLMADKVTVTGLSFQIIKESKQELQYFVGKNGLNYIFKTGTRDKKPTFTGQIVADGYQTGYIFGAVYPLQHQKYVNALTKQSYSTYNAQYAATGLIAKSALSLPPTAADIQAAINKKSFNFEDYYFFESNKTSFTLSVWKGPTWGDMADNQDMESIGTKRPKTKSDIESILQAQKNRLEYQQDEMQRRKNAERF